MYKPPKYLKESKYQWYMVSYASVTDCILNYRIVKIGKDS